MIKDYLIYKKFRENLKFIPKRIKEISMEEMKENVFEYYDGKISNFFKDYLSSGIGESLFSAPIYALSETWVQKVLPFVHGIGVEASKTQRIWWAILNLIFLGFLSNKGRDIFRWFFKYDDSQKELIDNFGKKKTVLGHDGKLGAVVGTISGGIGYLLGKNNGIKKVIEQTIVSSNGAYINGAGNGLANDILRECVGFRHPKRIPEWLKKTNQQEKYALVALMMVGSFLSVEGIYESYDAVFNSTPLNKIRLNKLEKKILPEFREFSRKESELFFKKEENSKIDGLKVEMEYLKNNKKKRYY